MNRWTSPELDKAAISLRTDVSLKLNASRLKQKFMTSCEVPGTLYKSTCCSHWCVVVVRRAKWEA